MALGTLETYPDVRLTLSDIDPKMVAAARERFAAYPGVTIQEADATQLQFADNSFDVVVSYLMLHHMIRWDVALADMHRVLRPGGRLIGYDLTRTVPSQLIHVVDRSPHLLLSPDELRRGLSTAGFADVKVSTSLAGYVMRFTAIRD